MQCTTSKAGKGQRKGKGTEHTQREGAGAHHLHPVDTTTAPKREPQRKPLQSSKLKYILDFAPFGLRNSRENTKAHQKIIHFCHFCPDDRQGIGWRVLDVCPDMGRVEHKRGTPPPIAGATSALHPHNFSHHKNRKKFAQEDIIFRTENIEKSQPQRTG